LDEALVLGLGAGATAAAVGLAFDHTDVVEINPVLVRNQHRFSEYNFDIGRNPQVNVIVDDGIHHVRSTAKRYSLILNTVTSPLYFSSSKLYTREFLESVRGALEPDGIYMTWLDSRVGGRGIDIMLVTLAEVFPHCRLAYVRSGYFLLIASAEPPRVWHPEAPSRSPELRDYFFVGNDLNPDWMSYAVVSPNAYKLIGDRGAPLNTLDRPELEFAMARHQYQGYSGFRVRLSRYVTAAGMEGLNTPAFTWNPAHFLAHAEDALGDGWLASAIRQAVVPSGLEGERFRSLARADFFRDRAALTDSARDHYYEGVWARRGENYDRAIEAFSKCLDRKPDFNNAWFGIALSHERSGAVDEAINAYRLELEIDPKDRDVWPRLGRLLHGKGLHIEAVDALSRALERRVNPELLLLRGLSYEALGRGEEASSDFRRVLGDGETRARALDALLRVSR
jgi:spermidine synthase